MLCLLVTTFSGYAKIARDVAAGQSKTESEGLYTVEVVDLSPKFLAFYNDATASHADADERWQIWQKKYGFAAVPPIAAGQKMARERLDEAWGKYPAVLSRIEQGAAGLDPSPLVVLTKVGTLLGATKPVHIRLIAFVGTFHKEAFAMGMKEGVSTIAIPLEDPKERHEMDMTHEFTHAVQMQQGGWSGQSVSSAVFSEGLAMRVTKQLLPGLADNAYAADTAQWMQGCGAKLSDVLQDLKAHLGDQGADAVSKFTFGTGAAGLTREVYCGGWFVVGRMLSDGSSYAELGHRSRADAEASVAKTIEQMMAHSAQ